MRPVWPMACALAACAVMAGSAAAQAKNSQGKTPALKEVILVCEAVYQPARTVWTRIVSIGYDQRRVRTVLVDGVPVYTFSVDGTVILTSIDNERIQLDTAALTWTSDFRGQATAQGRCERR